MHPRDAAQRILELQIDPTVQTRLDVLAEKANQGILSAEEREEYESLVEGLDLLAVLKTKARTLLQSGESNAE